MAMSKPIRDQLVTVQRMIEATLRDDPRHVDDFRKLAALAETQLHLVRALEAKVQPGAAATAQPPQGDFFDPARLFDLVDGVRVVLWERDDWCCPVCEGDMFRLDGSPKANVARPSGDRRYVRADLTATCEQCGFASEVGHAAQSWHMERAGLEPLSAIAEYRAGLT